MRASAEGGRCHGCRGLPGPARNLDADLRFWLVAYGARVPAGTTAAEFIAAGGAPPDLVSLGRTIWRDALARRHRT